MAKYVVRYGTMRFLGVMVAARPDSYRRGDQVIVRTDRGLELGEVLRDAPEEATDELSQLERGQILRPLSADDRKQWLRLLAGSPGDFDTCCRFATESGLKMQVVDVERLFGGERIIVYFLAEERVDFRDLVRRLSDEFQTRIEMRQIGVRDEAKLLADYGDCGKPVCCNTHLTEMPPVSMKMAKLQKATLDPAKISGRCGRLKCCLRYEYETYQELRRELPPVGADVVTNKGRARVVAQEILAGQLVVELEDRRRVIVEAHEVLTVLSRGRRE